MHIKNYNILILSMLISFLTSLNFPSVSRAQSLDSLSAASEADKLGKTSMISGLAAVEFSESQQGACYATIPDFEACANLADAANQADEMILNGEQAFSARDGISGYIFDWADVETQKQLQALYGASDSLIIKKFLVAIGEGKLTSYSEVRNLSNSYVDSVALEVNTVHGLTYDRQAKTLTQPDGLELSRSAAPSNLGAINATYNSAQKVINERQAIIVANNLKRIEVESRIEEQKASAVVADFNNFLKPAEAELSKAGSLRSPASINLPAVTDYSLKQEAFLTALSSSAKTDFGVSSDNLFDMVSRRFQEKVESREFIFEEK